MVGVLAGVAEAGAARSLFVPSRFRLVEERLCTGAPDLAWPSVVGCLLDQMAEEFLAVRMVGVDACSEKVSDVSRLDRCRLDRLYSSDFLYSSHLDMRC